jgi:ABC-type tungstate transport system substrate-binding protein
MPIEEIAESLIKSSIKLLSRFFIEIVIELLIKGTGYYLCQIFIRQVNPNCSFVVIVGLLFWFIISLSIYFGYQYLLRPELC